MQMKMREIEENQELILNQVEDNQRFIKGGSQPDKQIKVCEEDQHGNKVPGSSPVSKIMYKARRGSDQSGITSSQCHDIVEDHGFERTRQSVLNMMESISNSFPGYEYKKRKSDGQENVLFHRGGN